MLIDGDGRVIRSNYSTDQETAALFLYVSNDPINRIDPSGQQTFPQGMFGVSPADAAAMAAQAQASMQAQTFVPTATPSESTKEYWASPSLQAGPAYAIATCYGYQRVLRTSEVTYILRLRTVQLTATPAASALFPDIFDIASVTLDLPPTNVDATLAAYDKIIQARVDEFQTLQEATDRVTTIQNAGGLLPLFDAVDAYKQGKPWKLAAGLDIGLLFAPLIGKAIGAGLRVVGAEARGFALRLVIEAKVLNAGEELNALKRPAIIAGIEASESLRELTAIVPQGIRIAHFQEVVTLLKAPAAEIGGEAVIQGSRASYRALPGFSPLGGSDLDIAIRVSPEKFDKLVKRYFGDINAGSAKEATMLHAVDTGKITARWARLSGLSEQIKGVVGKDVHISIIRIGGPFDQGPFIHLP